MNIYDSSIPIPQRIEYLINELTVDEKISQLMHDSPAIEHLNIPKYNWWNEALHGVGRAGLATVFPQAIGLSATFDEKQIKKVATVISDEARAKYYAFNKLGENRIYKGLTFWSPNINIFRDPRWGRGQETYGEDPLLTARIGTQFVKGLQGDDDKYLKLIATPKHFYAHSGPEDGRHSFNSKISSYDKYNTYLPAFKACIDAGAYSIMTAYNRVNGEACVSSEHVINKTLRGELNFKGVVVSDCGSLDDTYLNHKVTQSHEQSASKSLIAGLDLECGKTYMHLQEALEHGLITESDIDRNLRRVLKTRFKLGQFDKQITEVFPQLEYDQIGCESSLELSKQTAAKSFVLLKNDNLIPISDYKQKSILIVGPNAASYKALLGNYYGTPPRYVTIVDAAYKELDKVKYVEGCHMYENSLYGCGYNKDSFAEVALLAEKYDIVIFCGGLNPDLEGEEGDAFNPINKSGDRVDIGLPAIQTDLVKTINEVNKNIIFVNFSGSCVDLSPIHNNVKSILQVWYPGGEGGQAIIETLIGKLEPEGRLPITFYSKNNQLPEMNDYSMQNRTYKYFKGTPYLNFGYGLDLIEVELKDLEYELGLVKVNIKNRSPISGITTIQFYIQNHNACYHSKLIEFKKVYLVPNEMKEVKFTLDDEMIFEFESTTKLKRNTDDFTIVATTSGIINSCITDVESNAIRINLKWENDELYRN